MSPKVNPFKFNMRLAYYGHSGFAVEVMGKNYYLTLSSAMPDESYSGNPMGLIIMGAKRILLQCWYGFNGSYAINTDVCQNWFSVMPIDDNLPWG